MPISSTTNRVSYQGDGTSAVFAFPYRFHAHSDLGVYVYNSSVGGGTITQLTLNAAGALGFTVSATANASNIYPNGGSVIFNSTPNSQSVVTVYRDTGATNDFSVGQNGAIPSTGLTNSIDRLTIIAQRLKDLATRAIRLPDGFYPAVDLTLPAILQPEQTIILNSTATGLAVGPTSGQVATAQSSALAAAASEAAAVASAVAANSAAVSVGNNLLLVNSAVTSIGNAVSLIGSTAYWGAEAQSSALSAFNSQVFANSAAVSAGNNAASAAANAISASSSALSANNAAANIAVIQSSGDLIVGSGAGSAARLVRGTQNQVLRIHGSSSSGVAWRTNIPPRIVTYNSGASQAHSISPNVAFIKVRAVGGGGGGGGTQNIGGGNGSGGGGGGYLEKIFIPVSSTITYTVGIGGAGGTTGGTSGTTGGSSIILASSITLVAAGGGGGVGGAIGTTYATASAGGFAMGGDLNLNGGDSAHGFPMIFGEGLGGNGGGSAFCSGGTGSNNRSNPPGAGQYGSGGGGGGAAAGAQAGASGGQGLIIIEESY